MELGNYVKQEKDGLVFRITHIRTTEFINKESGMFESRKKFQLNEPGEYIDEIIIEKLYKLVTIQD